MKSAVITRLLAIVMSRMGIRVGGLVLLLAVVWMAGPYVGLVSTTHRMIAIGIILATALLIWGGIVLLVRLRGRSLGKALGENNGSGIDLEVEALQEKFKDAVDSLKASDLGVKYRGSAALYALPWYMIIGPSAAGKSTLLRNSGLHFPYANQQDTQIQGLGGTRNCDWWFSEEAVILDTAGRYTTEAEDRDEWFSFLSLLKKYRRRRPINGVIVALSMEEILLSDGQTLEQHVKIIRERLSELTRQLGLVFPVYIVFTKLDVISGFDPYFGEMDSREREQVWGVALRPLDDADRVADEAEIKIKNMINRVASQRLHKMSMQRRLDMKSDIFDFPSQLEAATERVVDFVSLLVRTNPYQDSPNFAGVYFTSATQQGSTLQRVIGGIRQVFGYKDGQKERSENEAKPFFVRELFTRVVFPNSSAVGRTRKRLILNRGMKSMSIVAGLATVSVSIVGMVTAYGMNANLLKQVEDAAHEFSVVVTDKDSGPSRRAMSLQQFVESYVKLDEHEKDSTWFMRLGGYVGTNVMEPVEDEIVTYLETALAVPMADYLEGSLRSKHEFWENSTNSSRETVREEYYEHLKQYLMLSDASLIIKEDLVDAVTLFIINNHILPASTGAEEGGKSQAGYAKNIATLYVERMMLDKADARSIKLITIDEMLIRQSRLQLDTPPVATEIYAQMVERGKNAMGLVRLDELVGAKNATVVAADKSLAAMYTKQGWSEYFRPELEKVVMDVTQGDWVLDGVISAGNDDEESGGGKQAEKLRHEIRALYFSDYQREWLELLSSFRVRRFHSVSTAAERLLKLASSDGPLAALTRVTSENLNISELGTGDVSTDVSNVVEGRRSVIAELDSSMLDLRRVVMPVEGQPVSERMSQYLSILSTIQGEVEALAAGSDNSRDAREYAAKLLSGRGIDSEIYKAWVTISSLLGGVDISVKKAIEPLLREPIREAWRAVVDQASGDIESQWRGQVMRVYDRRLKSSYPFNPQGDDAALADVEDFFRHDNGVVWQFINENLSSFIERKGSQWRAREWLGIGLDFSRDFLNALRRTDGVTNSLFSRGSSDVSMTYYLYPIPTSGLSEVVLESNGQRYRYRNEPQEWRKFTWPGDTFTLGATVKGVSNQGSHMAELEEDGIWGLFRLIAKAKVSRSGGNQYLTEWRLNSADEKDILVKFKIKTDRKANIIDVGLLRGFVLPDSPFMKSGNLARLDK